MTRKILIALLFCLLCATAVQAEYYAVLIVGDEPDTNAVPPEPSYDAFWNDLYLTWEMLWTHGWKNENIYVLFGEGNEWDDQNDRYNAEESYGYLGIGVIVDYSAYYEDVENIFNWLAEGDSANNVQKITGDDFLFVWTFGHGYGIWVPDSISGLRLMAYTQSDTIMPDSVFADLMDQCAHDKRAIFMQQCYSGGFIDNLENEDTFIMTATPYYWPSPSADDSLCDGLDTLENEYYPMLDSCYHHQEQYYHLVNAVRLKTIAGNSLPDPDENVDGLTSLTEIWNWVDSTSSIGDPRFSDDGEIGNYISLNIPPDKPTGLSGERVGNSVKLIWNRNSEYDLDHYDIYKKIYIDSLQLYQQWSSPIASTTDTTYTDPDFAPSNQGADTVWYKITAVDEAGNSSQYSDVISSPGFIRPLSEALAGVIVCIKELFSLGENYPDPFNPSTTINYTLPEAAFVELKVYDIIGREVATLVNEYLPAGSHQISFDGKRLASGVYLYRLKARDNTLTKKMVLTR